MNVPLETWGLIHPLKLKYRQLLRLYFYFSYCVCSRLSGCALQLNRCCLLPDSFSSPDFPFQSFDLVLCARVRLQPARCTCCGWTSWGPGSWPKARRHQKKWTRRSRGDKSADRWRDSDAAEHTEQYFYTQYLICRRRGSHKLFSKKRYLVKLDPDLIMWELVFCVCFLSAFCY